MCNWVRWVISWSPYLIVIDSVNSRFLLEVQCVAKADLTLILLLLVGLMVRHGFFEDLADLLTRSHNRFVTWLQQVVHLLRKNRQFRLVQLNLVLWLNKSPIDALENPLLNGFLVAINSLDQEIHVSLHKEDLALLLLTESIELKHLDETLAGLLYDSNLKVVWQQLHTGVKVAEYVIDVASNFTLLRLHYLIESTQQVMIYVK